MWWVRVGLSSRRVPPGVEGRTRARARAGPAEDWATRLRRQQEEDVLEALRRTSPAGRGDAGRAGGAGTGRGKARRKAGAGAGVRSQVRPAAPDTESSREWGSRLRKQQEEDVLGALQRGQRGRAPERRAGRLSRVAEATKGATARARKASSTGAEPFVERVRGMGEGIVQAFDQVSSNPWFALLTMATVYVHHSLTAFVLPALLPAISEDLHLSDDQGAALTVVYTLMYSLSLLPVGKAVDAADRAKLLTVGLLSWSGATIATATAHSFGAIVASRSLFAIAQATMNTVAYQLIPELFPEQRSTAMSLYNTSIYLGRSASYLMVLLLGAGALGFAAPYGVGFVGLEAFDDGLYNSASILYMQGDVVVVGPVFDYADVLARVQGSADTVQHHGLLGDLLIGDKGGLTWREVFSALGKGGLALAGVSALVLRDPRALRVADAAWTPPDAELRRLSGIGKRRAQLSQAFEYLLTPARDVQLIMSRGSDAVREIASVSAETLRSPTFRWITASATLQDIGGWSLIAWQASLYQREYGMDPAEYAPYLAAVLPLGGLIGGIGGAKLIDWFSSPGEDGGENWADGRRYFVTAASTLSSIPLAMCFLTDSPNASFAALLVGFALSEAWRAPAAVITRDACVPEAIGTGVAVHLGIRNIIGGLGPLAVVKLVSSGTDLPHALLLIPACYVVAAAAFWMAEDALRDQQTDEWIRAKESLLVSSTDLDASSDWEGRAGTDGVISYRRSLVGASPSTSRGRPSSSSSSRR